MEFSLCVVDDAKSACQLIESAFAQECPVLAFDTAEACLERLASGSLVPGVFLLDVDLPGIDGYALCRQIKANHTLHEVPVVFVSGLDDLESRLTGYDAGGLDFIVKPVNLVELRQKIEAIRHVHEERERFRRQIEDSESLSALVMSNLDEQALLIRFLRGLNSCGDARSLVAALIELARAYRLKGVVQVRLPDGELTASEAGENQPLEVSVLNHVRKLERIFEFRSRSVYNFDNITLMVGDMPQQDPELCGRLRDHLAIAAESAQAKLLALQDKSENIQARKEVAGLIAALKIQTGRFDEKYALSRFNGATLMSDMIEQLNSAFAALGMTDEQEHKIIDIVESKAEELIAVYDASGDAKGAFDEIAQRLVTVLAGISGREDRETSPASTTPATSKPGAFSTEPAGRTGGIELF